MLESAPVSTSILRTSPVPILAEMTKGASSAKVPCWQSSGKKVIVLSAVVVGVWFLTAITLRSFFIVSFDLLDTSLPVMTFTIMVGSSSGLSLGGCF